MQVTPFRDQYLYFLKTPYNSDYINEYLAGTDTISKFLLDEKYNSFISKYYPLIHAFPSVREGLINSNSLNKEFNVSENFEQIWNKHPHLTALLQIKVNSNRQFVSSILNHIEKDKELLTKEFKITNFSITNLEINKGDVHQEGKTTAIITFSNNVKIVYKPRTAGLDIAFGEVLKSFNKFDNTLQLKALKFIDKKEYSWCEYIENISCSSVNELEEYYTKTGVLLALLYFLKGVDIHFENIIANGSDPIIIDLECLFHNTNVDPFDVLNTGMCPILSLNGFENQAIDLSGMGAFGDIKMDKKEWKWTYLNSDALNLEQVQGYVRARGNMPIYKEEAISPKRYLQQILMGFDKATEWVNTIQKIILAKESHPFEEFQNKTFRIIPRTTQDYTDILNNSFTPNAIVSASSRKESIHSDLMDYTVSLPFLGIENKKTILDAELLAIERLDVPYFTGETSTLGVKESGKIVLKNYFNQTPYERILAHIMKFDKKEANIQKNLIQSSFVSCYDVKILKQNDKRLVSDDSILINFKDQIEFIGDDILKSSIFQDNGVNWNTFVEENGTLVFSTLNNTLYSGKLGIAIFLSNLSKHIGVNKYNKTINAIVSDGISHYKGINKEVNISFASGLTGLIHTLIETDPILYEETMLELSDLIGLDDIKNDEILDFIGGAAGCLSVLCSLYRVTKSKKVLSKCLDLGNHLMNKRVLDSVSQHKCWISSNVGTPLTGYSHGASGIGLALLKLYEISGKTEFKEAFYEALKFENYHYVESENNWKDLRNNKSEFQNSWCHGASGIGLARIEAYKILKDKLLIVDIQRAIDGTINKPLSGVDHYCCGSAGRFHFLMEASTVIVTNQLDDIVRQNIEWILLKKNKTSYYQTQIQSNISSENPSLYRGISGIGQMLIRYCQIMKSSNSASMTQVLGKK